GFARLQPLQLPAHFFAATGPTAETRPRSCPRSTSTITESCRARGSGDGQVKYSFRFPLNRTSMTSVNSLLAQRSHGKVLLFPAFEELLDPDLAEVAHVATERLAQGRGRRFGIGVRPARWLRDDLVDDAELQQILGGDLERLGGPLALARVLPQDRGAALGRNDGVHRALEHQHAVGEPHGERASRATFTDHGGDGPRAERRPLHQVARDLGALYRRQFLVDPGTRGGQRLLERGGLLGAVARRLAGDALQLIDLALELEQRTLEVQGVGWHVLTPQSPSPPCGEEGG